MKLLSMGKPYPNTFNLSLTQVKTTNWMNLKSSKTSRLARTPYINATRNRHGIQIYTTPEYTPMHLTQTESQMQMANLACSTLHRITFPFIDG